MESILIGLNSEYTTGTTYDVFISVCDPTSWQTVATGMTFSDFPISVGLDTYGVPGSCFRYLVSGDTGSCDFTGTGTTSNPCQPSPSPTPTPTSSVSSTPSVTPSLTVTSTPSVTPTVTPSITATVTPSVTPSTSNQCREYNFSCPNSPNTQVTEWQYVRCDGAFVPSHNQNPGESATMCLRIGTLVKLSGPGTSTPLSICSV